MKLQDQFLKFKTTNYPHIIHLPALKLFNTRESLTTCVCISFSMLFPILTIRNRNQTSGTLQELLSAISLHRSMQTHTFWKNIGCKRKWSKWLLMAFIHFYINYASVLNCMVAYIFSTAILCSQQVWKDTAYFCFYSCVMGAPHDPLNISQKS